MCEKKPPKPPKQFIKTHNQSQFGAFTLAQLELKPKTEHNKNWNEGNANSEHENQWSIQHCRDARTRADKPDCRATSRQRRRLVRCPAPSWVAMILWMQMRAVHAPQGSTKSNAWPCWSSIIHHKSGWERVQTQHRRCSLLSRRRARPS